jgi:signal transduction histidine kinase
MDENAALGGSLEISSSEKGTTVTAIVPAPGSEITSARENVA